MTVLLPPDATVSMHLHTSLKLVVQSIVTYQITKSI